MATSTSQWPEVPLKLTGGERVAFDYEISTANMTVGTIFASILLDITDYTVIPECISEEYSLNLDIFAISDCSYTNYPRARYHINFLEW